MFMSTYISYVVLYANTIGLGSELGLGLGLHESYDSELILEIKWVILVEEIMNIIICCLVLVLTIFNDGAYLTFLKVDLR